MTAPEEIKKAQPAPAVVPPNSDDKQPPPESSANPPAPVSADISKGQETSNLFPKILSDFQRLVTGKDFKCSNIKITLPQRQGKEHCIEIKEIVVGKNPHITIVKKPDKTDVVYRLQFSKNNNVLTITGRRDSEDGELTAYYFESFHLGDSENSIQILGGNKKKITYYNDVMEYWFNEKTSPNIDISEKNEAIERQSVFNVCLSNNWPKYERGNGGWQDIVFNMPENDDDKIQLCAAVVLIAFLRQ